MKYICYVYNDYEVIGSCDVKKFNEDIHQFSDNSWIQVNIFEKLNIPTNKLLVKNILKIKH